MQIAPPHGEVETLAGTRLWAWNCRLVVLVKVLGPVNFESLIQQNVVEANEFSFYHARSKSDQNSELTLGGRDSSRWTGDLVTANVVEQGPG